MITMQSGELPAARRTSSNDAVIVVWKPAASRLALTRTACSRSSVVISTRSGIAVPFGLRLTAYG
ncbi:MAG: hypothetical protein DMD36_02895 [Gemmatimonadetes bacterium]|nr:MAG: hypothetical protein DMD36_02895 [Gemmatimonadota bacterium]